MRPLANPPLHSADRGSRVSRNLHNVGQRAEAELGEERYIFLDESRKAAETGAEPTGYMTVGLDGGYVHACGPMSRQEGWFEVIVGKSITAQEESKCFAFVHKYDQESKRRVFKVLRRALRGEFDHLSHPDPQLGACFGLLFALKQIADRTGIQP